MSKPDPVTNAIGNLSGIVAERHRLKAINRDLLAALEMLTEAVTASQEAVARGEFMGVIGMLTEPAQHARAVIAKAKEP